MDRHTRQWKIESSHTTDHTCKVMTLDNSVTHEVARETWDGTCVDAMWNASHGSGAPTCTLLVYEPTYMLVSSNLQKSCELQPKATA